MKIIKKKEKRSRKLKKPYLSRWGFLNQFTVWIVDGNYIRTNIDVEFTDFGQHYRFPFIPFHEFWIDKEGARGEERYYIDHMLVEHKLMAEGMKYADACEQGDAIELRERNKSTKANIRKEVNSQKSNTPPALIKKIHKKLLLKSKRKISVWIVDGNLVRDMLRVEFTEGGHDKVYSFIPQKEVWIDDDVLPAERDFIILHELNERMLMSHGLDYETAHDNSTGIEYFFRHNPKGMKKKIKELLDDERYTTDL